MSTLIASMKSKENEVVIYARITDFEGLDKADKVIEQEQYELKPQGQYKGKVRVRKEVINGLETYTQTIKIDSGPNAEMVSCEEITIHVDKEFFNSFKAIASSGMIKTRYVFNIKKMVVKDTQDDTEVIFKNPDAAFEVDVFKSKDGSFSAWCKIDLELDKLTEIARASIDKPQADINLIAAVSKLPFKPTMVFLGKKATVKENLLLDILFKEVFTVKI